MVNFTITEAEVIRLTGYSRQQLQRLRLGSKQKQGGKEYTSPPVLLKGADSERYGRAVLYNECVIGVLQIRNGIEPQ